MNKATVADIQRSSVHDGPGLRTTVFFKGCPLSCAWCHNPECISPKPQMLYYPDKCIGCNMCEKGCFSGAKIVCGKEMSAEEIFGEILLDKDNYGDNGGAAFSGGEPLMYSEAVKELICLCRQNNISTAVETSLYLFDYEVFNSVDYIMADFKIWNNEKHKAYTGVENYGIKRNFERLDSLGRPFTVRTPVITNVNDSIEEISAIRNFLLQLKNIVKYELIPYHPLGVSKLKALGREEKKFEIPSKEKMELLMRYADING